MATLTVTLSDEVRDLAQAKARAAGFADLGEYVAEIIRYETMGGPPGLHVETDAELESLLASRLDGPSIVMDAADFQQIRRKLEARLGLIPGSRR